MNNKIKTMVGSFIVLFIFTLTGCGVNKESEYLKVATQYLDACEYEKALESFEQAKTENTTNPRIVERGIGITYLGLADYDNAIAHLNEALSLSKGIIEDVDYDINYYLASAYSLSGNTDKALEIYNSILALRPEAIDANYQKALIYLELNQIDNAKAQFDNTISFAPTNYDLIISISKEFKEVGQEEIGNSYLQATLDTNIKKMNEAEKGNFYYHLGDYENARISLESAKGSDLEATLMLGKTYEKLGDLNYAITVYNASITKEKNAIIYNQLALCYIKLKDYNGALDCIENALELDDIPNLQNLLFNEIVVHEYLLDFDKAKILTEEYLEKYPTDMDARREYEFLSTR